jgi:hypothetical protein
MLHEKLKIGVGISVAEPNTPGCGYLVNLLDNQLHEFSGLRVFPQGPVGYSENSAQGIQGTVIENFSPEVGQDVIHLTGGYAGSIQILYSLSQDLSRVVRSYGTQQDRLRIDG